jgi:D-3-phosphoglycerate dehydrogenase / 2-oxoglutarate reductase
LGGKNNFCFKLKKGKILFIDNIHPILADELEKDGFLCDDQPGLDYNQISNIIPKYEGVVVRNKIKIDAELLDRAGKLKFIARVGAGMENIDQQYAERLGIVCLNAPEGNRDAVGEQAIGMLLNLFNHLTRADKEVRTGIWQREKNRGIELGGKTIGIIGYGNTGNAFARKLIGFEVDVIAYDKYKKNYSDKYARETDLSEIFEKTDVLSFHVPLTQETLFMFDKHFMNSFKKKIFVINTARGKVLKTADLVSGIESGKILGACLDVLEYEGLTFENLETADLPKAFSKLLKMENVILSPHTAGLTHESSYKLAKVTLAKIRALYH